jgi:predicted RNA binding protein YcfA (HicA-like mRNA interferase family)
MSSFAIFRKELRELERRGYEIERTNGSHYRITMPGKPGVVFTGTTPSDHRGILNLRANIRRTFECRSSKSP